MFGRYPGQGIGPAEQPVLAIGPSESMQRWDHNLFYRIHALALSFTHLGITDGRESWQTFCLAVRKKFTIRRKIRSTVVVVTS